MRSYDKVLAQGPVLRHAAYCIIKGYLIQSIREAMKREKLEELPRKPIRNIRKRVRRGTELGAYQFWDSVAGAGHQYIAPENLPNLHAVSIAAGVPWEEAQELIMLCMIEIASGFKADENRLIEAAPTAIGLVRGLFLEAMEPEFRTRFDETVATHVTPYLMNGMPLDEIHQNLQTAFGRLYPFRWFAMTFPAPQAFARLAGTVDPKSIRELFLCTLTDLALPYERLEEPRPMELKEKTVVGWFGIEPRLEPPRPRFWNWKIRVALASILLGFTGLFFFESAEIGFVIIAVTAVVAVVERLLEVMRKGNDVQALHDSICIEMARELGIPLSEVRAKVPTVENFALMMGIKHTPSVREIFERGNELNAE